MFDLEQELLRLCDALEARGVEFALAGSTAMAIRGDLRALMGIELIVPLADEPRLHEAAVACGFHWNRWRQTDAAGLEFCRLDRRADFAVTVAFAAVADAPRWRWRNRLIRVIDRTLPPPAGGGVTDMSGAAIDRRIRLAAGLRNLSLSLAKATPVA